MSVTVLVTNHALPRHSIAAETVELLLVDAPPPKRVTVERIDENHANPRRLWYEMGKPDYLTASAIERLERASRLRVEPLRWTRHAGTVRIRLRVPPHAVAAVTVEFSGGLNG